MKSAGFVLLLLLSVAAPPCLAGEMALEPTRVVQGGVVSLAYRGDPDASAEVDFFSTRLSLYPTRQGAGRLLGIDLATAPGDYPLVVRVKTRSGTEEQFDLLLKVVPRVAKIERLTLPEALVSPHRAEDLERIQREAELLRFAFAVDSRPRFDAMFGLPVADPVGSRFGLQRILNGKPRSPHAGVDFRSPLGTAVKAPAPAVVVTTGDFFFTGKTVVLDHGGSLVSLYAHLDQVSVEPGDLVAIGQSIGTVGRSGRATGPHLHWSVRLNQARVDPLAVFEVFNGEKP